MSKASVRASWAQGLVILAAVAMTLWTCLAFGGPWASWVFDTFTFQGELIPGTDVLLGILLFGVLILPGLAVCCLGRILFWVFGVSVSESEREVGRRA